MLSHNSPAEVKFKMLQIQTNHDPSGRLKKGTQGCQPAPPWVHPVWERTLRFMADK